MRLTITTTATVAAAASSLFIATLTSSSVGQAAAFVFVGLRGVTRRRHPLPVFSLGGDERSRVRPNILMVTSKDTTTPSTTTSSSNSASSMEKKKAPLFVDGTLSTTTTTTTTTPQEQQQQQEQQQDKTRNSVQQYYGQALQTSADLQTNACCTAGAPPAYIQDCLRTIHPTVISKYYGCGLTLPNYDLTNCHILDLGCGAGRDVYIACQLVGQTGKVVGIDMTMEQLNTAREYQSYHANKFGYDNVEFYQGYLENLDELMMDSQQQHSSLLKPNSFDVIISNCVINLCTDKAAVLQHCYKLLKPGGEMYFSDVYANRRIPQSLQKDDILWGECLSGALYWNDFQNLAKRVGFLDPRLVEDAPITIQNKQVADKIQQEGHGGLEFYSATYRLFKIEELEPACEDFGQAVVYKGTIPRAASEWKLDKGHVFEAGKIHPVCGNTWNMLEKNPRLKEHFDFVGDFSKHFGIFEGCGSSMPYNNKAANAAASSTGGGKGSSASCC